MIEPNSRLFDALRARRDREASPTENTQSAAKAERDAAAALERERRAAAARAFREYNARVAEQAEAPRAARRSQQTNDELQAFRTGVSVDEIRRRRAENAPPSPARANRNTTNNESSSFFEMNNPRGMNSLSARNASNESSDFQSMNNPRGTGSGVPVQPPSRAAATTRTSSPPEPTSPIGPFQPGSGIMGAEGSNEMAAATSAASVRAEMERRNAARAVAAARTNARPRPSAARGSEMSADDLNALSQRRGEGEGSDTPSAKIIRDRLAEMAQGLKKGGRVKKMAKGGAVKAAPASRRGDGCITKGKTKGRMV